MRLFPGALSVMLAVGCLALLVWGSTPGAESSGRPGSALATASGGGSAQRSSGAIFYVSPQGNNTDGRSWATAWSELDQIDWPRIQPGDTVLLDGGEREVVYKTTLRVGRSGVEGLPVVVRLADEPARNGKAVIFGGRATPLPVCGQTDYPAGSASMREVGVDVGDHGWVVIDGGKWGGVTITGHASAGVLLGPASHHVLVRHVEIYDNGDVVEAADGVRPDGPGVRFAGSDNSFEYALIHDNGEDAFQSWGGFAAFTVRRSWLYNSRQHPGEPAGVPFNACNHSDGIQVYRDGAQTGLLVEQSVVGPGLTNGLILSEHGDEGAWVDQVRLIDLLLIGATDNNLISEIGLPAEGWSLERVTAYMPAVSPTGAGRCALILDGAAHELRDSLFVGGCFDLQGDIAAASGNCYWNLDGDSVPGGILADPTFAGALVEERPPALAELTAADFTPAASSPCAEVGSRIRSVRQLLALGE